MKKLEMDQDTHKLIVEVSALFGIKPEVVKEIVDYIFFNQLLGICNNDKKIKELILPYIGKLGVKYNNDFINPDTGKIETDVSVFVSLSDQFKKAVSDVNLNNIEALAEYIRASYINKLILDSST